MVVFKTAEPEVENGCRATIVDWMRSTSARDRSGRCGVVDDQEVWKMIAISEKNPVSISSHPGRVRESQIGGDRMGQPDGEEINSPNNFNPPLRLNLFRNITFPTTRF